MKKIVLAAALGAFGLPAGGCAVLGLGAAAGAGAVVADELNEDDGKFDPLEETREDVGEKLGIDDGGGDSIADDVAQGAEDAVDTVGDAFDDTADAADDAADDVADTAEDAADEAEDAIDDPNY